MFSRESKEEPTTRIKYKLLGLAILLSLTIGCRDNKAQNYRAYKLPSGKEIKVTSIGKLTVGNGDTGLVMNYLTDIPIENMKELRKEVDEIWEVFQKDVEKAQVKFGVIRATHITGGTIVKEGKGYGFVFEKRDDGKWHSLEDDKAEDKK